MRYNWQHPEWPNFVYDLSEVQETLYIYMRESGFLMGGISQLSDQMQVDVGIDLMVLEALKTSEIEGERFDEEDVRSSIRKELGLSPLRTAVKDPRAVGIGKLMLSVRESFEDLLTQEELFRWHRMVMSGTDTSHQIEIGAWRKDPEPMQVISGAVGYEKVHFEAPPSESVPKEMERFIGWFNQTSSLPGPVRAALSHLYFESIHPFADGNGRIGRAIAEKALSQDLRRPILFSLSTEIMRHRREYYTELSLASHYNMTITRWVNYFVKTV